MKVYFNFTETLYTPNHYHLLYTILAKLEKIYMETLFWFKIHRTIISRAKRFNSRHGQENKGGKKCEELP